MIGKIISKDFLKDDEDNRLVYDTYESDIIDAFDVDFSTTIKQRYKILKVEQVHCCGRCDRCGRCDPDECTISFSQHKLSGCSWDYALKNNLIDSGDTIWFDSDPEYWENMITLEKVYDSSEMHGNHINWIHYPVQGKIQQPQFPDNEKEAIRRFSLGQPYSISEFVDEDTIIAGYGSLNTDFEYPLPVIYIKQIFGTLSWSDLKKQN